MTETSETAKFVHNETTYEFPVKHGTIGPDVVDISTLYSKTKVFTLDPGFTSTASCEVEDHLH